MARASTRFLRSEARRLCGRPAPWGGLAACVGVFLWWWSGTATRVPPVRQVGALLASDIEGAPALVAAATAVAVGLAGCGGYAARGRVPYLRLRGVGSVAIAAATTLLPAAVTFGIALLGQVIALALARVALPPGITVLPSTRGAHTWGEWMHPALPMASASVLPDLASTLGFSATAAAIAAFTAAVWHIVGSAWIAGMSAFAATAALDMALTPMGLPAWLSPWWNLTHRSPWLHTATFGVLVSLFLFAITWAVVYRRSVR